MKIIFQKAITIITLALLVLSPYQQVFGQEVYYESTPDIEVPLDQSENPTDGTTDDTQTEPEPTKEDLAQQAEDTNEGEGDDDDSTPESASSTSSGVNEEKASNSGRITVDVDQASGALHYNYDIPAPQGVNGHTPSLSLSYNSEDKNNPSVVGFGWSLGIPMISRQGKHGTNEIYNYDDFHSSLSGELKSTGGSTYGARTEDGSYLDYQYNGTQWVVTSKEGMTYTFGSTPDSRSFDPADNTKIHTWYLSLITDNNGNDITYSYYKDSVGNAIYPDAISYAGIYTIIFNRETRPDAYTNYRSAFKVETTERVSDIEIQANGSWIHKYDLNYTLGDNGSRSMLDTITESGKNGTVITSLNPATLTYTPGNYDLTQDTSVVFPNVISTGKPFSFADPEVRVIDVNGDGLQDIIHMLGGGSPEFWVLENTGDGWADTTSNWSHPSYTITDYQGGQSTSLVTFDNYTSIGDLNGDGRDDLIALRTQQIPGQTLNHSMPVALMNNGTTWVQDLSFTIDSYDYIDASSGVTYTTYPASNSQWGRFLDVNSDGLLDFMEAYSAGIGGGQYQTRFAVFINDGSTGLRHDPAYTTPLIGGNPSFSFNGNTSIIDYNGDGLPDFFYSISSLAYILENTGTGWKEVSGFTAPTYSYTNQGSNYTTNLITTPGYFRAMDINSDRITDYVLMTKLSGNVFHKVVMVGTGTTWVQDNSLLNVGQYTVPNGSGGTTSDYPSTTDGITLFLDVDGDGADDIMRANFSQSGPNYTVHSYLMKNSGSIANTISQVATPEGATYDFTYKPTTAYTGVGGSLLNAGLVSVYNTVEKITTNDNNGTIATTTYEYADGHYYYQDAFDRRFAGFGRVTATDALGQDSVTYYHQGNGQQGSEPSDPTDGSQIGKVWKTERFDDQSNLMATTETTWASTSLGNDRYFVRPTQSVSDQDGKITTTTRTYNTTTGNLDTETVAFNDAQGYTDTTTDYTYTSGALQLPATITVTNGGNDWSKTRLYYDNLTIFGATNGVNGNMTKQSVWDGTNWIDSTYTYDTSGNVLTETDPKSNTTTYVYDTYDIYPALVTNAENHATNYSYNYAVGQPTTITDPNLNQTTFTYDGLGRTLTTKRNGTTLQSAQYIDVANPYAITTTHYDGATYDTYTYMDGLGRTIQTKTDLAPTIYATTDRVYDELGRVITQSLPYDSTTLAPTPANTNTSLNIFTDYDALDRPDVITDATGQINYFYNGWGTTVNDKNTINKTLSYNGQGNLIQVIENNNGSAYTTSYAYNPNGNLTWINDAQSNQRSFGYDKLGRREYATDGGSGTHTYTYDNNGNVLTWTTPNADVITYTYDDLNRIETEDSNSTAGVDVTYTYDQGTNGTGHLTQAISQGVTTDYTYDAFDHLASESRTIAGTSYTTTYTNDRQGIPTQIIYPDGTDIDYSYYNEGLVNTITLDNTTPLVTLSLYNANRQLVQQFGSAAGTLMNTYDDNQLYRLTNRTIAGVQDISYTYDNNGNVLTITDQSAGTIAKLSTFTYDDLNRLSTATITNSANNQDYTYTYTYSPTGNILTAGGDTYTYAGVHPQAVSDINGVTYTYDPNGNATTIDTDTFDYNYKNQLTEATVTTGSGSSGNGGGGTTPTMGDIIRTNQYVIDSGVFSGDTYTLTLDYDLAPEYIVMVHGGSNWTASRGPNADAARVSADPHGNFANFTAANELTLTRGGTVYDWQGVVTVIECLLECATDGFTLTEVAEVTIPAGTANTLQTVTHTFATPHTGRTAIINTGESSPSAGVNEYAPTRAARITPSGQSDVTIERFGAQARVPAELTQTLFNIQFGSNWDVETVSIDNWTSYGSKLSTAAAYTSTNLSQPYDTASAFTLVSSYGDRDGIGDGALSVVAKLGDGGTTVPPTTNTVSVGTEQFGTRSSTITVMAHPDLIAQHFFDPTGPTGTNGWDAHTRAIPIPVSPESTTAHLTATTIGSGQAYSRVGAWSTYIVDANTVAYQRPRGGQPFTNWFSLLSWDNFQDVLLTGGGTSGGGTTGGGSTSNNVIRTTDYVIPDGSYPNEDYALTLDQDLTDNYVIMINGGSTYPGTRGAYMDAVRVTADPHGNFATTTASNQVTLTRGSTVYDWRGVITVIECLTDCTTDGFTLAEVAEVDLPTGTANTLQTVTHTFATPHTGQTAIIKSGESTSDPAVGTFYGVTRGARITTAGTNDITIERYGAQSRVPSPLTLTLYNLEFGSAWDIEQVSIDNWTAGGPETNDSNEYATAQLQSTYPTNATFTLTTSYSDQDGIGDGALGIVTKLGNGGTSLPSQTNTVSVGSQYAGGMRSSTITVLSHPSLSVEHLFKPYGDTGSTGGWQTLTQPITSVTPDATNVIISATVLGTGQAYSRSGAWSAYVSDPSTVTYERPHQGQPFTAWMSVVDWEGLQGTTSGGGSGTPVISTYAYDHSGQRVSKTTDGVTTVYANKLYHTDGTEAVASIYSGTTQIATVKNGTLSWNLSDHLNSSALTVDDNGTIVQSLDYFPFGEERINTGSYQADKTFTNHYSDSETGLLYMGARYYSGNSRRFASIDPFHRAVGTMTAEEISGQAMSGYLANPQLLNAYSYALNNPMIYIDPNGEIALLIPIAMGLLAHPGSRAKIQQGVYSGVNTTLSKATGHDSIEQYNQTVATLSDDSAVWEFGMDYPVVSGTAVGLMSAPAVASSGAALVTIEYGALASGVGINYALSQGFIGSVYAYAAYGHLTEVLPGIADSIDSIAENGLNAQNSMSLIWNAVTGFGGGIGGNAGAAIEAVDFGVSLTEDLASDDE